ncbi:MAG: hypothetical protein ACYDCO_02790 [Armatimonadota bacterium]
MDDQERAKQLYFQYAGGKYYMALDGDLEEYERYRVSKEQEAAWREEFIAEQVSRLSPDDLQPLHNLQAARACEAVPAIAALADREDSYARLWCAIVLRDLSAVPAPPSSPPDDRLAVRCLWRLAGVLLWLMNWAAVPGDLRKQARRTARRIYQSLAEGPVNLTERHREEIRPHLSALNASTPEEYVRNYARSELEES